MAPALQWPVETGSVTRSLWPFTSRSTVVRFAARRWCPRQTCSTQGQCHALITLWPPVSSLTLALPFCTPHYLLTYLHTCWLLIVQLMKR